MYKRITAGTDFSETAGRATDRAAWLAEELDAALFLVHAGVDRGDRLGKLGERYGAKTVAREGSPADVLISQADETGADLIVVGNRGMSGPRRFLIGSVPNKVSHHSPKDLLIVKTDRELPDPEGYSSMVVGTDGSDTSMQAVESTAQLASAIGVPLLIACAFEPPSEHELEQLRSDPNDPIAQWNAQPGEDVPPEFRWRIAAATQAEDILERAVEHAEKHDAKIETLALEGHPVEAMAKLVDERGVGLIAVGNVGMSGAKRFMLGNVPHRLSHHAPSDLLILRTS